VSHAIWASLGFAGLAAWPAAAWRRDPSFPWGLRPKACLVAVAVQLTLLAWFVVEVILGAGQAGLAERVAGVAQLSAPSRRCCPVAYPGQRTHTPAGPAASPDLLTFSGRAGTLAPDGIAPAGRCCRR
jgi:hypothetical protein